MRKWIIGIMMLIIASVGGWFVYYQFPELLVKVGVQQIQKNDYALILENEKIGLSDKQKIVVQELLKSATYEVEEMTITGNEAKVPVEITLVDVMELIFDEGMVIFKNTLSDWRQTLSDLFNKQFDELAIRQLALVLEQTSKKPMKQLMVEVPFKQHYLGWKLDITEEWVKAVMKDYLTQE